MKTMKKVMDENFIESVERFKEIFMKNIVDIVVEIVEPNV
jgi:hypothetical protein